MTRTNTAHERIETVAMPDERRVVSSTHDRARATSCVALPADAFAKGPRATRNPFARAKELSRELTKVLHVLRRAGDNTTDAEKAVSDFASSMHLFDRAVDASADGIAVGCRREAGALLVRATGNELLYVRGREGVPARLIVKTTRGWTRRPHAGASLRGFVRCYYGDGNAIAGATRRNGWEVGGGLIVAPTLTMFRATNPATEKAVTGWTGSLALAPPPSFAVPIIGDLSVMDDRERVVASFELTKEQVARVEASLENAKEHPGLRRATEAMAAPSGPVPAAVASSSALAKGAIFGAVATRGAVDGAKVAAKVAASERATAEAVVGLLTAWKAFLPNGEIAVAKAAKTLKALPPAVDPPAWATTFGAKAGFIAKRVLLPVALTADAVDIGSAFAKDRSRHDGLGRTRHSAGRIAGSWAGAVAASYVSSKAVGHAMRGLGNVVDNRWWEWSRPSRAIVRARPIVQILAAIPIALFAAEYLGRVGSYLATRSWRAQKPR